MANSLQLNYRVIKQDHLEKKAFHMYAADPMTSRS